MQKWFRAFVALFVVGLAAALAGCTPADAPTEDAAVETEESEATGETTEVAVAETSAVPEPAPTPQTFAVGEDGLLDGLQPAGWESSTPFEHYVVENLYNKINGRSEMYMSYNVKTLSWADFVNPDLEGHFINVFVYDMQTASGAFGVFAAERETGQELVALGRDGYKTDGNYYFWKGQYYAYVQASHEDEATQAATWHVAQGLAERLADNGEEVRGMDWLPTEGLITDSVTYFLVDAMSLDFMQDTFTAKYNFGGDKEVVCFISKKDTPEAAAEVMTAFGGYVEDYGMSSETVTLDDGTEMLLGNLGGDYYDGGFVKGTTIAGISAIKGRDAALAAANAFAAQLSE